MELKYKKVKYDDIEELDLRKAIDRCEEKINASYSPYSGVRVIATGILENGELLSAGNQENIAFPTGVCAEVNLLSYCGSEKNGIAIKTLVVRGFTEKEGEIEFISPCGNCRQFMVESESRQETPISVVFGSKEKGFYIFDSASQLLPLFFSRESFELL